MPFVKSHLSIWALNVGISKGNSLRALPFMSIMDITSIEVKIKDIGSLLAYLSMNA
jgi:hypothetical protein